MDEPAKPRIVANVVSLGIGQTDEMHVPGNVGAIEPIEDEIGLAKSGVHERHGIRWHVALASNALQRTQHAFGLIGAP